jgi:hypothetical protein
VVIRTVDQELLADVFFEAVLPLQFIGVPFHIVPLPPAQRVGHVDMQNAQLFGDLLTGSARVPIAGTHHITVDLTAADSGEGVGHKFAEVVMHVLFANEAPAAERDTPYTETLVDPIELRLFLETMRDRVHPIVQTAETPGQPQYIDNLAAGVGLAQFRCSAHIPVRGKHEDGTHELLLLADIS